MGGFGICFAMNVFLKLGSINDMYIDFLNRADAEGLIFVFDVPEGDGAIRITNSEEVASWVNGKCCYGWTAIG